MGRAVLLGVAVFTLTTTTLHADSDCFCGEGGEFVYTTILPEYEQWIMEYPWEVIRVSPIYDMRSANEDEVVSCHVVVGFVEESIPLGETLEAEEFQQIFYGRWMALEDFETQLLESQCLPHLS